MPSIHHAVILAASACFALWISIADIVNCFQNTIRDTKDKFYMCLPSYYLEWFNLTYPNTKVTIDKDHLVVQLINVCQRSTDVARFWNHHFDRVLGTLGLHRSMRDLVVCDRKVYEKLAILNMSTDDVLVRTKSHSVTSKVINHLKICFPLTQKEGTNIK